MTITEQGELTRGLVGLHIAKAVLLCQACGVRYRTIERDGRHFICTSDFVPERANFIEKDNIITEVSWG